jgi:xanthine dehydrogenase YagR molybdenum-binding subunit
VDGQIVIAGTNRRASVQDVTSKISPRMIQGYGVRGPNPEDQAIRTFGAQCAEIEVDLDTGELRVLRLVASHDCGRIVNPKLVESQIIGAVTQGIGFALMEERIVDTRFGVVLNANLEFYEVPTVCDLPVEGITHAPHDVADFNANSTGAKGVGEPPLIPTAPAIANALFDAIGVRITDLPITRQRVLEALQHARI